MKKINLFLLSIVSLWNFTYAGGKVVEPAVSESIPVVGKIGSHCFYGGAAFSIGQLNTFYYGKDTVGDIMLYGGYNLTQYLDAEIRIHAGVKEGSELKHNYSVVAYLKPFYPLSEKINVYALAGYGQTKVTYIGSLSILSDTTTQKDFSYGAGISYRYNDTSSFFVDATSLIDKSATTALGTFSVKLQTVNFGYTYHF